MAVCVGLSGNRYSLSDSPFAGGGEGDIFNINNASQYVAKIFKQTERTEERYRKLKYMVYHKPVAIEQYAWPVDVITVDNKFAGYIMPKVIDKKNLRSVYVFDNRRGIPWSFFIRVAKNLAIAVSNVHAIHQVIGDLKPENILVDVKNGSVVLVDDDSYHITVSENNVHNKSQPVVFRCNRSTPEFTAPELQNVHYPSAPLPTFTVESDLFALAVLIFALLMNGAHPFACKTVSGSASQFQPIDNIRRGYCAYFPETCKVSLDIPPYAPSMDALPEDVRLLFKRVFVLGYRDKNLRPSAQEWVNVLTRLENNLGTCVKCRQLIYKGVNECPWCRVNVKMSKIASNPTSENEAFRFKNTPGGAAPNTGNNTNVGTNIGGTVSGVSHVGPSSYSSVDNQSKATNQSSNVLTAIVVLVALCFILVYAFSRIVTYVKDIRSLYFSENQIEETVVDSDVDGETEDLDGTDLSILSVDPVFVGETTTIEEVPSVIYYGSITEYGQVDSYAFTATDSGSYGFTLSDMKAKTSVDVVVFDSLANNIAYSCGTGYFADLIAGNTYDVRVEQDSGLTDYILSIGVPRAAVDITNVTTVNDQIYYGAQRNIYLLTAPVSGVYRFQLNEVHADVTFNLLLWDRLENKLIDTEYSGYTVKLSAGETYELRIDHDVGYGSYELNISYPKEPVDITGYDVVNDSIEYSGQINEYVYTPEYFGIYYFDLSEVNADVDFEFLVYDHLGYEIVDTQSKSSHAELNAGESYIIRVEHNYGYSAYKLTIEY